MGGYGKIFLALAALLLGSMFVVGTLSNTGKSAPTPTTQPPVYATFAPKTLLDVSGSGIKTTQTFIVGNTWDMAWSYNCASFGQGKGNFIVNIFTPNGQMSRNAGANQLGTSGSDVEHFHQGGTFYLEINSECTWHVAVTS